MKNEITNLKIGNAAVLNPQTALIRFEGSNTDFFWRIHGDIMNPDVKIVIPPTHQAIYIKDGHLQNVLESGTYPVFETVKKGFLGLGRKVDATVVDIIFMNRTVKFRAFWGTHNPIMARDPVTNIPVTLRGNGEFEVGIDNPKKFYLEIVGADESFTLDSLRERLHIRMMSYIESVIAKVMREKNISYTDIPIYKREISDAILPIVNDLFVKGCGLKVHSFTIDYLGIPDNEITAIESAVASTKEKEQSKAETKEVNAEQERLDDKKWDRAVQAKKMEMEDNANYYEVLKVNDNAKTRGHFCPNCGHSYETGMNFCPGCGKQLANEKAVCSECGQEIKGDAKFCPQCGHKIGG